MKNLTLKDFYPVYLTFHSKPINRVFHFIGTSSSIALFVTAVFTQQFLLLIFVLPVGYAFSWIGHFGFEKNTPAAFSRPIFSFICDLKMFWDLLTGKISFFK